MSAPPNTVLKKRKPTIEPNAATFATSTPPSCRSFLFSSLNEEHFQAEKKSVGIDKPLLYSTKKCSSQNNYTKDDKKYRQSESCYKTRSCNHDNTTNPNDSTSTNFNSSFNNEASCTSSTTLNNTKSTLRLQGGKGNSIKLVLTFVVLNFTLYLTTLILPTSKPNTFILDYPILSKTIQTVVLAFTLYWYSSHLPLNVTKIQLVIVDLADIICCKFKGVQLSYWSITIIILVTAAAFSIEVQLIYLLIPVLVVWLVDQYKQEAKEKYSQSISNLNPFDTSSPLSTPNTLNIPNFKKKLESTAKLQNRHRVGGVTADILHARFDEMCEIIEKISKRLSHHSQLLRQHENTKAKLAMIISENENLKLQIAKLEDKLDVSVHDTGKKINELMKSLKLNYPSKPVTWKRRLARLALTNEQIDFIKVMLSPSKTLMVLSSISLNFLQDYLDRNSRR